MYNLPLTPQLSDTAHREITSTDVNNFLISKGIYVDVVSMNAADESNPLPYVSISTMDGEEDSRIPRMWPFFIEYLDTVADAEENVRQEKSLVNEYRSKLEDGTITQEEKDHLLTILAASYPGRSNE